MTKVEKLKKALEAAQTIIDILEDENIYEATDAALIDDLIHLQMEITAEIEEEKAASNSSYCIFEQRTCKYAQKIGNVFDCTAPSDDEMICK